MDRQRAYAIQAGIIEQFELISYLYFRDLAIDETDDSGAGSAEQSFQCMLVKWLHDNKHLNTAQNVALPADKAAILTFVHAHFKGKIWDSHLTKQDRKFANFISDGISLTDENGTEMRLRFQVIGLKALGKWDAYSQFEIDYNKLSDAGKDAGEFYWLKQEAMMKNIPINDANYALFTKALDENFALYNRLMQLPENRKAYYFE